MRSLPPEVLEQIINATQDVNPAADRRTLLRLLLVSKALSIIVKRLLYRHINIKKPSTGEKLCRALQTAFFDRLGQSIRTLAITDAALSRRDVFSDLSQDDILRQSPSLVELNSPVSAFAPLSDGRKPFATYPATLKSIRLAPTFRGWRRGQEDEYDSEEDDEGLQPGVQTLTASHILSTLQSLPASLTSLTISHATVVEPGQTTECPLQHLTTISLDFANLSYATLKWFSSKSISNRTLKNLKVWVTSNITGDNLVDFMDLCGEDLRELVYKPQNPEPTKFPALRLIRRTPNLERLSLGNKAADHNLYSSLPRSLTHLCVALPENHVNARLPDMATMITTRLKKLIRLELYSQIYFPCTDIYYPPTSKPDPSKLREVRLSHIRGPPGTLDSFLASLGCTLHTLSLHHISANFESTLFAHCPKLRRLELGRSQYTDVPSTNRFSTVQHNYLHTLRVHFDSTLSVDDIVQELEASRIAGTHLRTLEIMGTFPGDVPEGEDIGWTKSGEIDRLMNAVKEYGTMLLIQGRVIESTGDLWVALFAMSQND